MARNENFRDLVKTIAGVAMEGMPSTLKAPSGDSVAALMALPVQTVPAFLSNVINDTVSVEAVLQTR